MNDHYMTTNAARAYASQKGWMAKLSDDHGRLVFRDSDGVEKGSTMVDREYGYLRVSRSAVFGILVE